MAPAERDAFLATEGAARLRRLVELVDELGRPWHHRGRGVLARLERGRGVERVLIADDDRRAHMCEAGGVGLERLRAIAVAHGADGVAGDVPPGEALAPGGGLLLGELIQSKARLLSITIVDPWTEITTAKFREDQIGRASCRERV